MNLIRSPIAYLGRALLSIIFIGAGAQKIFNWQETQQYFTQGLTDWLSISMGNPALQNLIEWGLDHAQLVLGVAVLLEVIGGLFVFLGIWVRLGSLLLILFLIPVTLTFHHFWLFQEPERQMQMNNFMKNASILGGLFVVLALGKGGKSDVGRAKDKQT